MNSFSPRHFVVGKCQIGCVWGRGELWRALESFPRTASVIGRYLNLEPVEEGVG